MDLFTEKQAVSFTAASKFFNDIKEDCYDKCVVNFATPEIGPLERECANLCVTKHMSIWKDMKPDFK